MEIIFKCPECGPVEEGWEETNPTYCEDCEEYHKSYRCPVCDERWEFFALLPEMSYKEAKNYVNSNTTACELTWEEPHY